MDDAKIDLIAREVLQSLKKAHAHEATHTPGPPPVTPGPSASVAADVSLRVLSVLGGIAGSPCVIEPDKVCIASLKCRTFGH
jgi:hypothetical protein